MIAIVGLGNFDPQYQRTKHNVGYWAVDKIKEKLEWADPWRKKKYYEFISGQVGETSVTLFKPLTFMNNSGQAVEDFVKSNNIDLKDLWVIFDDVNVDVGSFRVRAEGSTGGHNGVKSIIDRLGSGLWPRIRIGSGPLADDTRAAGHFDDHDLADFVLTAFSKTNQKKIDAVLDAVADYVLASISRGSLAEETVHI